MYVARNEQVHVAVAIVVGPGRAGGQPIDFESRAFRYILKFAIAQIVVKRGSVVACDKKIQASVVVEVGDRYSHAPAFARQASLPGDVREMPVCFLVIERDQRIATLAEMVYGRTIHYNDVQETVVVAIEHSGSPAHRFEDVAFLPRDMGNG